jgi:hypothetical protein
MKSVGAAAGAGAWEGITKVTKPEALAAPRPALWLTLPTGSDVLAAGKDAEAADPRAKKLVVRRGNKRRNWQKVG